jgi:hypothetical protein
MPDATPPPVTDSRRPLRAFLLVATILGVAAVGLNFTASYMKLNFRKAAVPPREPIRSIPLEIGPWLAVNDHRLSEEIEDELGTTDYISRQYVDTRHASQATLELLEDADTTELRRDAERKLLNEVYTASPTSVVSLHVAYYTGSVDTVPHVPDRCMLGAGFEMAIRDEPILTIRANPDAGEVDASESRQIQTSYREFQDTRNNARPMTQGVAYFFQVNGDYEHDAIIGVRKRLQNLFETHAYFAKIEVMVQLPTDQLDPTGDRNAWAMTSFDNFLSDVLPAIEQRLPDWDEVTSLDADTRDAATSDEVAVADKSAAAL